MAETVSIILEYLRQNKFTKAEAALCLELQARQALKEPIFLLPRDLDLLLGEPDKEDTAQYSDKIFPEDECLCKVALDSWSKGPSNRLRALEVHLKGWEPESTSCDEVSSGLGTLTMHQKLVYENSERDSYHRDSLDSTSLPSATFVSRERRLSYDIARGPTIKDIESGISTQRVDFQRSKHSTKGIGPMCLKDQITEEGTETAERIIEVQNDQEECPIRHENNTSTFLQQDALDTHTGRVDCVVEHISKASPFCEPYEQAANALKIGMQRWERSPDISSHEQQEMPAYQPEQCTIVYESRDFSEHYSFNGNSQFEQSALFPEFPQDHHDSFTRIAYGASADNGWFDHCVPSNTCSKTSSNGIRTGSFQPSFLSCPIIEDSPDQHEQCNKNHAFHEVSKAYSFERESRPVDYLKDIAVPWEVAFQNEETQLGGFEEGKNCTDESRCTGFPRLAHVKTRSIEKDHSVLQDDNGSFYINSALDGGHDRITNAVSEPSFSLGSFLDIPVGQNTPLSGSKWQNGSSHLSISQGIVEDTPELLSGFATLGHEPSDSGICYPQEYWESDAYEDDEDPGYHRQPIQDEAWFLAHEIEYPSDDDKANMSKTIGSHFQNCQNNCDHDDFSQAEEESYFSREQFYKAGHNKPQTSLGQEEVNILNPCAKSSHCNFVERSMIPNMSYGVRLMNAEELKLVKTEHILEGFDSKINQTDVLGGEKSFQAGGKSCEPIFNKINDDSSGSVRFGDAGISCDAQDLGSKEKNSMLAAYREWEKESLGDLDDHSYQDGQIVLGPDNILHRVGNDASRCRGDYTGESDVSLRCVSSDWVSNRFCANKQNVARSSSGQAKYIDPYDQIQDLEDGFETGCGSFSFQSPKSTDDLTVSKIDFGKSVQITENTPLIEDADGYVAGINRHDETLTSWKGKGDKSSPILSVRGEAVLNGVSSLKSVVSSHSNYDSLLWEARREKYDAGGYEEEEIDGAVVDDEEADALQKEVQQLKVEEDEYEIFNLRIVHRKNRTGFEEEKNFPIVINSVIAGRYLVTEYLGSAAFSKAIQARDLQTGMDVCMKIIKNNKDFLDQSLDEIKLLKFINKHDPADKYHILRLYDYFYYREHLFIVCELLRANLYEFHKFNRESGGEMYFTMSRLQSITRQCLEALEFLHGLGLIHCDLKPENILVKSYSRCEVKVIDLGSSCFQLDHLCPYVQSRSYRAPEVILGLLYNQKIDIWSLGCILAELCSGHVLFQNDSIATLLARVFGIIGPVNPEIVAKGRDTYKYFTRHYMLYERNQETNQLEYLLPKKTSLRHRLPMGDQGFVDFVGYLLQINPENRPTASEALKHPWLSYPYEPLSS